MGDILERLGPYALIRELSRGGGGVVYEAEHAETGARYALKALHPHGLGGIDLQQLKRFQRESQALGALKHPNVVRIHAADLEGPLPYLVQDLLTGGTLEERLRGGRLALEQAVEVATKLASGLAAAHAQGILHRDLKPSNVLFDEHGEPVLVDFGLARSADDLERLTQTGSVLGTPAYMAPEQARGKREEDVRSDVYGLGGLVYVMLTGQPPTRERGSVLATLNAVVNEPVVPPGELCPGLPRAVEGVCLRALSKAPADRYPDVIAFAEALRRAGEEGDAGRRPPVAVLAVAGGLAVVALGLIGALALSRPTSLLEHPEDPPAPAEVEKTPLERAREALAADDPEGALALAAQPDASGRGARDWQEVRGLAHLLAGRLDLAREALGRSRAAEACDIERRRRLIFEQTRDRTAIKGTSFAGPLFEDTEKLVESARVLGAVRYVGPVLASRVQETAAIALLDAGEGFGRGNEEAVKRLLQHARDLVEGSPGEGVVVAAWACLLYEIHDRGLTEVHREEVRRLAKEAQATFDLAPRWRAVTWGVLVNTRREGEVISVDALPIVDPAGQTLTEREALNSAYNEVVRQNRREAVRFAEEGRGREAATAWRASLEFAERSQRCAIPNSQPWEMAILEQVALHLFARDADSAARLLEETTWHVSKFRGVVDVLSMEVELLERSHAVRNLRHLDALLREHTQDRRLRLLCGAFRFQRGKLEMAQLDLEIAERLERPQSTYTGNMPLPWRTLAQTRLEIRGERGARAVLAGALRSQKD